MKLILSTLTILLALSSPLFAETTPTPEFDANTVQVLQPDTPREINMDSGVVVVAVNVPDLEKDPLTFAQEFFNAAKSKDLRLVVIFSIIAVVFVMRRWGQRLVPWFNTDRGGAGLALAMGLLGQVVLMLSAGAPFTAWLLVEGLINGVTAAGGVVVLKRLLNPQDII